MKTSQTVLFALIFAVLLLAVAKAESNSTIVFPANASYDRNVSLDFNYTWTYNESNSRECIAEIDRVNYTVSGCKNFSLSYIYNGTRDTDLVLALDFSDGAGNVTHDRSPQFRRNITNGVQQWNQSSLGRFQNAMSFNGTRTAGQEEQLNVSAGAEFNITLSQGATYEAWVNVANLAVEGEQIIMGKATTTAGISMGFTGSAWWCGKRGVSDLIAPAGGTIQPNSWTHVVCVWNSSGEFLYTNGIRNTSNAVGTAITQVSSPFIIGNIDKSVASGSAALNGTLAFVAVYNRSLRSGEISDHYNNRFVMPSGSHTVIMRINNTALTYNISNTIAYTVVVPDTTPPTITVLNPGNATYNLTNTTLNVTANEAIDKWWYKINNTWTGDNDLKAYWPFTVNTTASEGIIDASKYGNNGTAFQSASYVNSGKKGDAWSFNGLANYLQFNASAITADNAWSVSAWVYLFDTNATGTIISLAYNQTDFINVYADKTAVAWRIAKTGNTIRRQNTSTGVLGAGQWNHIVVTKTGDSDVVVYVNTTVQSGRTAQAFDSPPASNSTGATFIGRIATADVSLMFNGTIDEVHVYNRSLNTGEIQDLYNSRSFNVSFSPNATFTADNKTNLLTVYANDTSGNLGSTAVNFTVNTAPTVSALTILPNPAYINDTGSLNVSFLYNDSEGNPGTVNASVYRNGINIQNFTRSNVANNTNVTFLITATGVHFDNYSVRVSANDSTQANSAYLSTSNLTISDTAPNVRFISFNQSGYNITQNVNVSVIVRDIDLDTVNISAREFRNSINVLNITFAVTAANATNVTFSNTVTQTRYDNFSFQINVTSNGLSSVFNSSNVTILNSVPRITAVLVNETYAGGIKSIRINATVLDTDGTADINQVNVTIFNPAGIVNETIRMTAAGADTWEVNYTANTTNGNWSVEINANDTSNALAARVNGSFIVDTLRAVLFLNSSDNGLILGNSVNLTVNFEDINLNYTRVYFNNPDNTLNFQRNFTGNTTHEFNSTIGGQRGNYTLNITAVDLAGNANSTTYNVGFGQINITIPSFITSLNGTTVDTAIGDATPLLNNTFWNISFNIPVTMRVDGQLTARSNRTQVNLTKIVGNWTTLSILVTNSSTNVSFANNTDIVNFSTDNMNTGQEFNFTIKLDTIRTLNYTVHAASSGFYYFIVSNNSADFSEYVTIALPSSEVFDASATHPRYFVCTSVVRSNPPSCSTFTASVDVTSSNNGNNGVSGYTTNMKVKGSGIINNISYLANHTDFLLQVVMVAGAFAGSSSPSGSPSGGGGGAGAVVVVQTTVNQTSQTAVCNPAAPDDACCPPPLGSYHYNNATKLCDKPIAPIAAFEFGILQREVFMGLTVFHFIILLGVVGIIANAQKAKLRKVFK